jgi:TolA-binding protein
MRRRAVRFNGRVDIPQEIGYVYTEVCNWSPPLALRAAKSIVPSIHTVVLCLLLSLTASGLPSCVATDFVSAYFNTYYNAQRLFNEAETEVFAQLDSRSGGRSWLGTFAIQAGTKTKLESVIEKCSKLLQYHSDSKLVDDALMMIGKAYYYEDENQQAERKFNEIISGYPDGSRAVEARLLLAYAQYRMNTREEARKTAQAVIDLARKNDQPEMISRASLVLGQMAQEDKDYAAARENFDQAAQFGATPEQRSSASLMSAEMYRKMSMYREAEDAYQRAEKASDNYSGEYRGRVGAYRMMEKQGLYGEALRGFRFLRTDAKNKEFFPEIELEVANTLRDSGDLPEAVDHYTIVDTTYPRSESSARSYFALGDLYEHTLYRYDSALVAYTKGRGEFPLADVTQLSSRRADYLTRYFQYYGEFLKYDTVLAALHAPPDSMKAQRQKAAGTDTLRPQVLPRPPITLDSANARRETAVNELAGLFFVAIGIPDSAEFWYTRIVQDYPSGRYVPRALYTLAQIYAGRDSVASKPAVDSLYREIVRRFPRSDFAPEARRILGLPPAVLTEDDAEKAYKRAEHLMIGGDSAGAVEDFKNLARQYPGSPLASRALFAAGWIYENRLFNRDSAIASYTKLMTLYPASPYAVRIVPKITEVNLKRKQSAAPDTSGSRPTVRTTVPGAPETVRTGAVRSPVPGVPDSVRTGAVRTPVPGAPETVRTGAVRSPVPGVPDSVRTGVVRTPVPGVPDSVRTGAVRTPVPGVPDSLQRREEIYIPKQSPAVTDTNEVKRIPTVGPRKVPDKEGPTP